VSQVAEIVRAATGGIAQREERQELQLETRRVVGQLVRAHTSRLRRRQRQAALMAALAVGVGAAAQAIRLVSSHSPGATRVANLLSLASVLCAALLGLYVWLLRDRAHSVEHAIEDATETLDDKSFLVAVIYEIAERAEKPLPWTRWELREAIEAWSQGEDVQRSTGLFGELRVTLGDSSSVASLASIVGPDDFTRLVIAKCQERGVLTEQEGTNDQGRLVLTYDVILARPRPT
jgi:hypothetical protein